MNVKRGRLWGVILFVLFTVSCSDPVVKELESLMPKVEEKIEQLNDKLDDEELNNAIILKEYAKKLEQIKSEYQQVTASFLKQIEPDNDRIKEMEQRFNHIKDEPKQFRSNKERLAELVSLSNAADYQIYNDSLIDPINTMADLSDGALPRLQESGFSQQDDAASRLVGNPNYGRWENRGGQSIWVWLAAYSLFNNMSSPYYYHRWYYNRPWSYHHDYGRTMYSSRGDRRRMERVRKRNERNLKDYGRSRGRHYSSYNSRKNNNSFQASTSTRKAYRHSTTTTRNRSSYAASHRSGSRSSSRRIGRFRGK